MFTSDSDLDSKFRHVLKTCVDETYVTTLVDFIVRKTRVNKENGVYWLFSSPHVIHITCNK